jgi:hypothetical protein
LASLNDNVGEPAIDTPAAQFWKSWRECQVKGSSSREKLWWRTLWDGTTSSCMNRWLSNNPDHYLAIQLKRTLQSGK